MSDLSKYEIDPTLIKANFKALKENQITSENIKIPGQITFSESNIYLGTGQKAQIYRGEVLAKSPRGTYDWTKEEYMNATKNDNQLYCLIEPLDDYDIDWAIKDYVQQMGNKILMGKEDVECTIGTGKDYTTLDDFFDFCRRIVWTYNNGKVTQLKAILDDDIVFNKIYKNLDIPFVILSSNTDIIKCQGSYGFISSNLGSFTDKTFEGEIGVETSIAPKTTFYLNTCMCNFTSYYKSIRQFRIKNSSFFPTQCTNFMVYDFKQEITKQTWNSPLYPALTSCCSFQYKLELLYSGTGAISNNNAAFKIGRGAICYVPSPKNIIYTGSTAPLFNVTTGQVNKNLGIIFQEV